MYKYYFSLSVLATRIIFGAVVALLWFCHQHILLTYLPILPTRLYGGASKLWWCVPGHSSRPVIGIVVWQVTKGRQTMRPSDDRHRPHVMRGRRRRRLDTTSSTSRYHHIDHHSCSPLERRFSK